MNKETKDALKNDYPLIPMSDITDEARAIAVAWIDGYRPTGIINLEQKHKLASDIMNYARRSAQSEINEQSLEIQSLKAEVGRLKGLLESVRENMILGNAEEAYKFTNNINGK